jgi:hypothetical protein
MTSNFGKVVCGFLGLVAMSFLLSCASTQQSMGRTKAGFDEVWKACIDSLSDVRFSASSTDPKTGLIIADSAVVGGGGAVSRLNIMVSSGAGGTEVSVKFVPPFGTVGGYGTASDYIKALQKRIPDLAVTEAK